MSAGATSTARGEGNSALTCAACCAKQSGSDASIESFFDDSARSRVALGDDVSQERAGVASRRSRTTHHCPPIFHNRAIDGQVGLAASNRRAGPITGAS
jgi:hypothetical protein